MKHNSLTRRSLWHYRRSHLAVAAGVAVATAVLVGALIVGDSVRGSLRDLTLERLGQITYAIAPGRPFRAALADELQQGQGTLVTPILTMRATLSSRVESQTKLASGATLVGCKQAFWRLGASPVASDDFDVGSGALITTSLAQELDVGQGDDLIIRIAAADPLPADSPLGEKSDTIRSLRVRVERVIEPAGLARFALRPSQQEPRNVFLPLEQVQDLLELPGQANAVLISGDKPPEVNPRLRDYGLALEEQRPGVWQLESDALVLQEHIVQAAKRAFRPEQLTPVATYLANTLRLGDKSIPYSTIAGVEWPRFAAQFEDTQLSKKLAENEIVLNQWAAADLGAKLGDTIGLTYYEPESTHGELREATPVELLLVGVVPLEDKHGNPTPAADPRLTPQLEGVTDAKTIDEWDLPFELVEPIRSQDEDYWDERSTTPKAFVSFALARRLWGTRWGEVSLLRTSSLDAREEIEAALLEEINPAELGFAPLPIREQGLRAASGSTPFDVLFLMFSMFLIASALLLVALLAQLSISMRSGEIGLLSAVGWRSRAVRAQLLREHLWIAACGAMGGVLFGIAYAALLIFLLQTVWVDAITTPFLQLHITSQALLLGGAGGLFVSWLTMRGRIRSAAAHPPRALLAGAGDDSASAQSSRPSYWSAAAMLGVATVVAALGATQRGETAAGAFFGVGASLLIGGLLAAKAWLQTPQRSALGFTLWGLALRSMNRNRGRSLLMIGLMAAACFLILATGAFRLPPTEEGVGGFSLVATTDQPLHYDLNTSEGQLELGLSSKDELLLENASVYALRAAAGEDASCRNLYQSMQPRVLGVTDDFISQNRFAWAEVSPGYESNPWSALAPREDGVIRAVLDYNTAVYALKLYGGVGSRMTIRNDVGQPVVIEVAGLLKNSLLQGELLVSEADFLQLFPQAGGYGFFLIDCDNGRTELENMLENRLRDFGFDAVDAEERLAQFLAVQNSYLSTFQALGALGLLLGAVGLAIAQFRTLAERRGELALLRAAGFSISRLRRLVLAENMTLLLAGLLLGAAGAGAALAPLTAASGAEPPWIDVTTLVVATLLIGLIAGRIATGQALAAPITPALRGE